MISEGLMPSHVDAWILCYWLKNCLFIQTGLSFFDVDIYLYTPQNCRKRGHVTVLHICVFTWTGCCVSSICFDRLLQTEQMGPILFYGTWLLKGMSFHPSWVQNVMDHLRWHGPQNCGQRGLGIDVMPHSIFYPCPSLLTGTSGRGPWSTKK